jgi:ParB family chromosome partitioning protein
MQVSAMFFHLERCVMKSGVVQLNVPLSHLVPSRRNPRKVKPSRDGHHRLLALIRSQGLLQPLVVRPIEGKPKHYEVVAGERRLRALKEIHHDNGDPRIPCIVRNVDTATADALSLGENFGREAMHPLDEADAFAKLASNDGKDAEAIAAEFGVTEHYVRQRMKLSTLAQPVKDAYRQGQIDNAMAEAFAAVPKDRQLDVWKEVNGNPRHAEHVRNVIAHAWIDSEHALFELSSLSDAVVSRDLFNERVLVERQAFMEAQANALESQRQALIEEGWNEVIVGRREDVQDRLYSMDTPEGEYDEQTNRKLARIAARREKLEVTAQKIGHDDEPRLSRLQQRYEALETEEREVIEKATEHYSEETKAMATSFLILDPDGRVHREYRIPRRKRGQPSGPNGNALAHEPAERPKPPTSDDLSDAQRAVTFTHQALAVREALLKNTSARKRILAMILHEKIRSEALAVRHEANGTDLQAGSDGFSSTVLERLKEKRSKLDPFHDKHFVEDEQAYEQLAELSGSKLDSLIDLLTVGCMTAHLQRPTQLVNHLATELKVNVRDDWRPDAQWLSGFKKIQLAHLIIELKGQVHAPSPDRKKSDLVDVLAKLFADAAEGKLEDKSLAQRINTWLPANIREVADNSIDQITESD